MACPTCGALDNEDLSAESHGLILRSEAAQAGSSLRDLGRRSYSFAQTSRHGNSLVERMLSGTRSCACSASRGSARQHRLGDRQAIKMRSTLRSPRAPQTDVSHGGRWALA